MAETVRLTSGDGFEFPAYVARPRTKTVAAVVVLQEIFGVNSHIRAVADGYAQQGYLAVAPDLFHRLEPGIELGYEAQDVARGRELKAAAEALAAPGVLADIAAAITYAGTSAGSRVGLVGFCWGGLLAWRSACLVDGLSAAVAYYGGGMTGDTEARREPKCPVMCHFGDQDHAIPINGVRAFAKAQPKVEVHVYPAAHGFNCDQRSSYDAQSANAARERTLAFFARHLA